MARRLDKTLIDYLVIAISPALIMTLIGSLVFFLLDVFYRGPFDVRVKYVLALYVFAAVLVGRIAVEEGKQRARLFAFPLAAAAFVVLLRFAGPLNLVLILLILWSADKLTWDCTVIDEGQRDTGKGLLQVAGLDKPKNRRAGSDVEEPAGEELEGLTSRDAAPANWWKRLLKRRPRPHAAGLSVVYFSLAALPLFGVGQLLIPPQSPAQGRALFFLLVYVASGLGLLLSTSFLGLRRYLRQRKVQMPAVMASTWLAIGCILIVGVLMLAALLPRPGAGDAFWRLPLAARSKDQGPSPYAAGRDGIEAEQGQLRSDEVDQEDRSAATEGERENEQASDEREGKNEHKSRQQEGGSRSRSAQEEEPEGARKEPRTDSQDQPQRDAAPKQDSSERDPGDQGRGSRSETQSPRQRTGKLDRSTGGSPQNWMRAVSQQIATLFRWIFYLALVLIGVWWLWTSRAQLLAALRGLLQGWRGFWENLFGRRKKQSEETITTDGAVKQPLARPFAAFSNPFAASGASRLPTDELVRYTFEALQAWAREHGCPRQPEQTPHEFARQLGVREAPLRRHARRLADLYCRVAYAPQRLPAASVAPLEDLWQELR